ncbi:hypothetical protein ACFLQK_02490 [bacterium]
MSYGGKNNDGAESIIKSPDGGYVISGYGIFDEFVLDYGTLLLKIDESGKEEWSGNYGVDYVGESVVIASDTAYVVVGRYGSLAKVDSDGNELWVKQYGGEGSDNTFALQKTSDNGYVISGYTTSFGADEEDAWILKVDSDGNQLWSTISGLEGSDQVESVQETTTGDFVVAGYTTVKGSGNADGLVIKFDSTGNKVWAKQYGGDAPDFANTILNTDDGGYIVSGRSSSFSSPSVPWIFKLDSDGNEVWSKTYNNFPYAIIFQMAQTSDGGYILAGWSGGTPDVLAIKVDSSGNEIWARTIGGADSDYANSVEQTTDGGYIFAGVTQTYSAGSGDVWILKLDTDGYCDTDF